MSELYVGTKFTTVFFDDNPPQHQLLSELIYWCELFQEYELTPAHAGGTSGNLSFRINANSNEFVITGAGLKHKNKLGNEHFVHVKSCDLLQKVVNVCGSRLPSSESMMHYAIYQTLPHVNAIFHGHHQGILSFAEKLNIPTTEFECQYGSIELINSIMLLIEQNVEFFIIKNHGFISLGSSMKHAGERALSMLEQYKELNR